MEAIIMHTKVYYHIINYFKKIGYKWDQIAPTKETAVAFAHTYINEEPERRDGVNYSLEYCLAHSGETINERFRKDRPYEIDLNIAKMVSRYKTKIPIVLYRGVSHDIYQKMLDSAKGIPRVDLHEKAFLQASLVKGCEIQRKIKLRIYVPAGTEAVYLGNVNDELFYYEVDIQRGMNLKIISMDKDYINCMIV
jgi:hypothetical protein